MPVELLAKTGPLGGVKLNWLLPQPPVAIAETLPPFKQVFGTTVSVNDKAVGGSDTVTVIVNVQFVTMSVTTIV